MAGAAACGPPRGFATHRRRPTPRTVNASGGAAPPATPETDPAQAWEARQKTRRRVMTPEETGCPKGQRLKTAIAPVITLYRTERTRMLDVVPLVLPMRPLRARHSAASRGSVARPAGELHELRHRQRNGTGTTSMRATRRRQTWPSRPRMPPRSGELPPSEDHYRSGIDQESSLDAGNHTCNVLQHATRVIDRRSKHTPCSSDARLTCHRLTMARRQCCRRHSMLRSHTTSAPCVA